MGDTLARSYKYRFYPTATQAETLEAWQSACHTVQVLCVRQRRAAFREEWEDKPNWATQGRAITQERARSPRLAAVPADTMSAIAKRVEGAYKRMFKAIKEGARGREIPKPKWARRSRDVGLVFRGESRGTEIVEERGRWGFWKLAGASKLGPLKVRMHRPIPEGGVVKQAHITRDVDEWHISFSCVIPAPEPLPATGTITGVDLGCIHEGEVQRVAVLDDGRIYRMTDALKRSKQRLATLQKLVSPDRALSDSAKGASPTSRRTARRREKIAKLHRTIRRQRRAIQQYIARRLVEESDTIVFEDVQWGNLRAKGGTRKKGLNRSMSTASLATVVALTREKAEETGREVVTVSAAYTSQACSACGDIPGEKKGLGVRLWRCGACGAEHDRDINAAQNIRARGVPELA